MATLRNKQELAAVTRETHEEHLRNGQSRNTSVPRIDEEYIRQVSGEIEARVTRKLSQEFSRIESRILGALSKLDELLLNPQIRTHSGTVPGTFRNTNVENQEPNEDRSQDDPHPEVGPSVCQSRHSIDSDPDEAPQSLHCEVPQPSISRLLFFTVFSNELTTCPTSRHLGHADFYKIIEPTVLHGKLMQHVSVATQT